MSLYRVVRSIPLVGGDDGIRTHDPLLAGQVLSQLSYTPLWGSRTAFQQFSMLALIYLPAQSPVKYCRHW